MPRAEEGGDETVGQEGVGKANVEPEEVAPWEMVTREGLTEVDAKKRVEEVALHSAVVRSCRRPGCTMKRRGLRSSEWMSLRRIDGYERSTSSKYFQTPPRKKRRDLTSSVQMFRN